MELDGQFLSDIISRSVQENMFKKITYNEEFPSKRFDGRKSLARAKEHRTKNVEWWHGVNI